MNFLKKCFLSTIVFVILLMIMNSNRLYYTYRKTKVQKVDLTVKVKTGNQTFYIPTIYRGDCKVMSIDSLKEYSEVKNFTNGISNILHFVSNEEDISKAYAGFYKNCMKINSDMKIILWTDASFYNILISQFSREIVNSWEPVFSNLESPVRTTMIRSMAMFLFGGVSLSLDTICQQPIRSAMPTDSCFVSVGNTLKANIELGTDDDVGESVFGCVANHPFLLQLILNSEKIEVDRNYFTNNFLAYNKKHKGIIVSQMSFTAAEQVLPKGEMDKICARNTTTSAKQKVGCHSMKSYNAAAPSKAMMIHQPVYGISHYQIVADDVCAVGAVVHIVIM